MAERLCLLIAGLVSAVACGRALPPVPAAAPSAVQAPAPVVAAAAAPSESVLADRPVVQPRRGAAAALERDYALEAPRSTSSARRVWPLKAGHDGPSLVTIGRAHLQAGGQTLLAVRCDIDGRPCQPAELRGPLGRQVFSFDPEDLAPPARGLGIGHATIAPLLKVARKWRGRVVLVLVDRRVAWLTVQQVLRTLRQAGADSRLGAVDVAGRVVELAQGRPLTDQPAWQPPAPGPAQAEPAAQVPDLRAIEVQLDGRGAWLQLKGALGLTRRVRLKAPHHRDLAQHARHLLTRHPGVRGVSVVIDDEVQFETVVASVDALRDHCAGVGKGICKAPRRLFASIELSWSGDWLEPTPPVQPGRPPVAAVGHQQPASARQQPKLRLPAAGGLPTLVNPNTISRHILRPGRPQSGQPPGLPRAKP